MDDTRQFEAFTRTVEGARAELMALCRALVWHPSDFEDAVQETLLCAFRSYDSLKDHTALRRWLFKTAVFTVYNINRKAGTAAASPFTDESPGDDLAHQLELEDAYESILRDPVKIMDRFDERVSRGLRELNENERTILLLRSVCDVKYCDIAEILDVPLGSVMGNLARARAKLRKALAEYSYEM